MMMPVITYSQTSNRNIKIGITKPIIRDHEIYEGLDYFVFKYYEKYLNKVDGVETLTHFTVNDMISENFRNKSFDKMYSGLLSQLQAYMKFDLLLTPELFTVTSKKTGNKYIRLGVVIFDIKAKKIIKFKVSALDKFDFVNYLNESIDLIVKKLKKQYPKYAKNIVKSEKLNNILKENENLGQDPSLAYFYIKDMSEEYIYKKSSEIDKILRNEGFLEDDIINAFSKKYMAFGQYGKALSYMISRFSRKKDQKSAEVLLDIIDEYMKARIYPSAIKLINGIILYKNLKDHIIEAKVNIKWSNVLIEMKDFISAEAVVLASTDTSRKYGYLPSLIESMNNYAYVYSKIGKYKDAMKALEYTRKKIEESESRIWASDYLYEEARTRFEMSEFDKAFKSAKLAEQLFESAGRTENMIKNNILKAYMYTEIDEYDKANEEINKAMKLVIETKDYIYIKPINEQMRETAKRSLNKKRAYSKNNEKKYVKLYNDNIKYIYNRAYLRGITLMMMYMGNYGDATRIAEKLMELSSKIKSDKYLCEDNLLYAKVYESAKDYANAFLKCREALTNAEKSGSKLHQISCMFSIARLFRMREKYNEALSTFEVITKTAVAYGMMELLENSYYEISLIHKELGDNKKYVEFSRKAFTIAKKIGSYKVDIYNEPLKN